MKKRDITRFGVMVAVVIVLAVLTSFALLFAGNRDRNITLPPVSTPAQPTEAPSFSDGAFELVELTTDSVQNVIATLYRPLRYTRTVTVEQFWPDGRGGMDSAQAHSQLWVDSEWTHTKLTLPTGQVRHTIVWTPMYEERPGELWSWEEGQTLWYHGASDAWDADLAQWCPTYEDVLKLDPASITAAGYELKNDAACIFVEVADGELDYLRRFWVSVEDGLLMAAETWEDDELVYQMTGMRSAEPGSDMSFALPDGTVLHEAEEATAPEAEPGQG